MDLIESRISTEEIFDGKILHVIKDTVKLPNGSEASRELIRHVGAVCIIPLFEDSMVIMERQFRYPVNEVIYEIPAGKLDSKDEIPELAAARELEEETGYTAGKLQLLGPLYPACAYSDERINMYLATELKEGKAHLDSDEFLNIERVKLEDVAKLVIEGKIPDSKTQIAILRVLYMKEHGMI